MTSNPFVRKWTQVSNREIQSYEALLLFLTFICVVCAFGSL